MATQDDLLKALSDDSATMAQTPVNVRTDLSFDPVTPAAPTEVEGVDVAEIAIKADKELDAVSESLDQLRGINQDRLAGKIPSDVLSELRKSSAEKAQAMGLGDSPFAGRNLEARDLGLTSLQIQQMGEQSELNINKMAAAIGELQAKRHEFFTSFQESSRQFNESLADQKDRTGLLAKELILKRDSFNAEQNLKIINTIADLVNSQAQVSSTLAINDKSDAGIVKGYKNILSRLDKMLKPAT